jgi:F-type H+-transporting ATPase subunit a
LETKKKWRWGVKRWVILLLIIVAALSSSFIKPVQPEILVVAENVSHAPLFGNVYLTNTLIATLIGDVVLLLLALAVKRAVDSGELIPKGISGAMEALIEALYNLTEGSAGKWAKTIFPYFATITLIVLCANWLEMLPGVDSIGWLEKAEHGGNNIMQVTSGITSIVYTPKDAVLEEGYKIVPFVRPASTDLNFTAALALIAVVMIQYVGFKAQGFKYITKFINLTTIATKPGLGLMDFLVGLLELISELSKILSFAFRLFGNVFAGSVLLFLVGSMLGAIQSGVLLFEFFIGLIQAIVFGMLTMVFMSMATQSHGGDEGHAAA